MRKAVYCIITLATCCLIVMLFFTGVLTEKTETIIPKEVRPSFEKTTQVKANTPFVFKKNEGGVSFGIVDFSTTTEK